MKIYIAGPMRGKKFYNFPAFFRAEGHLAELGWSVFNPARMDIENGSIDPRNLPDDHDWNSVDNINFSLTDAVARDAQAIQDSDAIYMLRGWEYSTGARAEHALAVWLGINIYYQGVVKCPSLEL